MPDHILKPFVPPLPTRRKVRCLGPIQPDHWFESGNPLRNRVCGRCEERLNRMSPRVLDSPAKDERA